MKCQNCGKNEVSFHYSSNINGCVTETHLCAQCASMQGFDFDRLLEENVPDARDILGNFYQMLEEQQGYSQLTMPVIGFGAPMTFRVRPRIGAGAPAGSRICPDESGCECGKQTERGQDGEVDKEMQERRELRMQMHRAARNEDFERAAELRDKLKAMEM